MEMVTNSSTVNPPPCDTETCVITVPCRLRRLSHFYSQFGANVCIEDSWPEKKECFTCTHLKNYGFQYFLKKHKDKDDVPYSLIPGSLLSNIFILLHHFIEIC